MLTSLRLCARSRAADPFVERVCRIRFAGPSQGNRIKLQGFVVDAQPFTVGRGPVRSVAMASSVSVSCDSNGTGVTKIAFVGDVHDQWDPEADSAALRFLNVDTTILVGDFANDNPDLIAQIAAADFDKMIMLGNHDAWKGQRAASWTKKARRKSLANIANIIDAAGSSLLAWNCKQVPGRPLAVVGSRPFSRGGPDWERSAALYQHVFGCGSFAESADRIFDALNAAPSEHAVVVVGHNGPAGLGDRAEDICGADFLPGAGDWGDLDLQSALRRTHAQQRDISLVAFGHMHDSLRYGGRRRMLVRDSATRTCYLNTAVVPRVRGCDDGATVRHFAVAEFAGKELISAKFVWVRVAGGDLACSLHTDEPLLRKQGADTWQTWNTHTGVWENCSQLETPQHV